LNQPLIISAGMPRAGSGWYFNLLNDLVVSNGGQNSRVIRKKYHLERFLTEINCNISTLSFFRLFPVMIPAVFNNKFVIKTHAGPSNSARFLIRNQRVKVAYIFRDPRAALLSAYEYGQRAINRGRPNAFSHLHNLDEAAYFIEFYVKIWEAWSGIDGVLVVRYEDLLVDYQGAVEKTSRFLDFALDNPASAEVVNSYLPGKGDPGKVGTHFSKGQAERFRTEIDPDKLEQFSRLFELSLKQMGYEY
jgi:hypothetical protein